MCDFWEWVCHQAYNEKSAKLVQASDHTRKLLRELEIESETRAKIEAESHRLRGELASMRGRCVDVRVAVCCSVLQCVAVCCSVLQCVQCAAH